MTYIIKAYSSKMANPDYYDTETPNRIIQALEDMGFIWIEPRKIVKHNATLEGIIKRCRYGSQARRRNLQALYNLQTIEGD